MARTVLLLANQRRSGQYLIIHNLTGSIFVVVLILIQMTP